MKAIAVGNFKINCLAVLDEVQTSGESVLIPKHGKPLAKMVPAVKSLDDIFGFMDGKGVIVGDVVSPVLEMNGGF